MSTPIKKYCHIYLLLAVIGLFSCQSDECPTECPSNCVPINFILTQNGNNILEGFNPIEIDDVRVESTPENVDSPPSLGIDDKAFKMVVCKGVEYQLHLNDSVAIKITTEIDTLSIDECCVFFSAKSVEFNNTNICSNQNLCTGGTFELD